MTKKPTVTNEELAAAIKDYWRSKGKFPDVWAGTDATGRAVIRSNMVDGLPPKEVDERID